MKVLIAGGGIGGLTAALCCHHFGHDVTVFEQASELTEIGAGLQVPPNAMKVFEALGIDKAIAQKAFRPHAIEARMGVSGRSIFTIPLGQSAAKMWDSDYLHIHRADFIDTLKLALLSRIPNGLQLGAAVTGFNQGPETVKVRLSDGRDISGDVLVGADGIKSVIRETMFGPDAPVFTGNVAWRVVVPITALSSHPPNPTACVWMGRGRHGVTYRLRGGDWANFVGVVESKDWTQEGWTEKGNPEDALKDFEGWHPTITDIIKSAAPDSLYRWALYDRAPLESWTQGRTALLGDAAHPMLPFMAQGAAMAVEDSWVLARELSQSERSAAQSLRAYHNIRSARTAKAQATSRANMSRFHQRTLLGKLATYGPMWLAGKIAPKAVHKRMDWLYKFDVTKEL